MDLQFCSSLIQIDAVAKSRDGKFRIVSNDEREQTLNQLLTVSFFLASWFSDLGQFLLFLSKLLYLKSHCRRWMDLTAILL